MTPDEASEWIFPPDVQPLPCPRCGRRPVLVQDDHLSRFECRRWFGLVLHREGAVVMEGRDDGEYARRAAARAWNRGLEPKP